MFNFAFIITPQNIWFAVRYWIHTDVQFFSCFFVVVVVAV